LEYCGATWSEIDLDRRQWTIPGGRRKDTRTNARRMSEDHVAPLARQAVELLEQIEEGEPDALIFAGRRGAKHANWPRWTTRVEKKLGFKVTPHALRRTCATLAGDLGQPPHVVSALLGHHSIGGALLAGYNQSRYRNEVAQALQQIADMVDALAAGGDNIVTLASKRA
jgi:integrase